MTLAVPYFDLPGSDNFSVNLISRGDTRAAEEYYLKRDYGQFFLGLIVGVILTLMAGYWYRGGLNFPRPGSTVDVLDGTTERGDPTRPGAGTFRVRGANVRMRSCPGINCREIARLQGGSRVADLGQAEFVGDQEWIRVRADGQEGWVDRYYLE
jgi:hypothetical protein